VLKCSYIDNDKFEFLSGISKDVRYIYDEDLDEEHVVFLHGVRDVVAMYQTTPLYQDPNLGYSVMKSEEYFKKFDKDHMLVRAYCRVAAVRRIKRHPAFKRWLEAPLTRDGEVGIECRLAMRAIAREDKLHFPDRKTFL